jgi:arylsulfatase A-like enzyme
MVSHGPGFTLAQPVFSRSEEQRRGWQRDFYDDSILQFDSYVRSVYDELKRSGKLDDTLLIVTSDHGAEHDATQRVPLLVRYPNAAHTGRVDVNVERLDIAPTVLDVLGYDKPAWMSGQSLVHVDRIPADRQVLATTEATAFFLHGVGYHSRDGGIMLTVIRCGDYANVQPDGSIERGRVPGSTAKCDAVPEPPVADDAK